MTPLFINWWDKYIYDPVERSPDLESANMFFMFLLIFPKYPYVHDKSPIHIKVWLGYIMLQYILCNLISTRLKRETHTHIYIYNICIWLCIYIYIYIIHYTCWYLGLGGPQTWYLMFAVCNSDCIPALHHPISRPVAVRLATQLRGNLEGQGPHGVAATYPSNWRYFWKQSNMTNYFIGIYSGFNGIYSGF